MIVPPRFLFLSINETCNLHCLHCDYWKVRLPSLQTIRLPRTIEILTEFADLSPGGRVVICGGEPMLDPVTYFEVCRISRNLGLTTLSITNGTLINSLDAAKTVISYGPDEIGISLDSPVPKIHDRMRGTPGSFLAATSALLALQRARHLASNPWASRKPTKIYAMGLLSASTYRILDEFYQLVLTDIGCDKLKLNAIQPTFLNTRAAQSRPADLHFQTESQVDPDVLQQNLISCNKKWDLHLNPEWIEQVVSYFRDLWHHPDLDRGWQTDLKTSLRLCDSGERNIMVDVMGRASLCFSSQFPSRTLHQPGDLRRFWEEADQIQSMTECRALCGISHSVRRVSATMTPQ